MNKEELSNVLKLHKKYLDNDGGERANLNGVDLSNVDLRCVNLRNANLSGANLSGANLRDATLSNTNLRYANLRYANLWCANLRDANLCDANLCDADLSDADLSNADLRGADLWGADLSGTIGNMKQIKSLQIDEYPIVYTSDIIQIGCENHTIEEWKSFDDEKISKMDKGALEWWSKRKETLFKIIEMSPAEPTKG